MEKITYRREIHEPTDVKLVRLLQQTNKLTESYRKKLIALEDRVEGGYEGASLYKAIAKFFLPLSLTNLIINLSHSIVNAGVARTPDPEISLAAYALARGLVSLIESPMFMARQTVSSLVDDTESFRVVSRFLYAVSAITILILAVLAFSPAGYYVLANVMGASPKIAHNGQLALRILFLLPAFAVIRNVHHGVAIIARQTSIVPVATTIRLVVMSTLIFILARFTRLPGAVCGSLSFVGAFCVEAIIMSWRARPLLQDLPNKQVDGPMLTISQIISFFLPLVATSLVGTAFQPLINTGLARSTTPEVSLAAYAVGHGLASLALAPLGMLHQCTLVFTNGDDQKTYDTTKRFTTHFSLLASFVIASVSFSPLGPWILKNLMGVSSEVSRAALEVMKIMTVLPLLVGWREYMWGILMQRQTTGPIGTAKGINLIAMGAILVLLLATGPVDPAAAGAWAMVLGELANCLWLHFDYVGQESYYTEVSVK